MDAHAIARMLSRGQRSAIAGMDETPAVLGCSEPCAIGLAKGKAKRPALVMRTPGKPYARFHLNADGLAVKAAIQEAR